MLVSDKPTTFGTRWSGWHAADNEFLGAALRRLFLLPLCARSVHVQSKPRRYFLQDVQSHHSVIEAIKSRNPEAAYKTLLVRLARWEGLASGYVIRDDESAGSAARMGGADGSPV